MDVLELGCGWGSLTLWMAERYPASRITAVSNSHSQRACIEAAAARRGLGNVEVLTEDMNRFATTRRFDRIVSVEMFERMRNWRRLFSQVRDWLSRHFFSGGMMPSDELALRFQDRLRLVHRRRWDGTHYEQTSNAWLANVDARRDEVLAVLATTCGADSAERWLQRWRIFFMACAELFGYQRGQEWWVSHYLFERPVVGHA